MKKALSVILSIIMVLSVFSGLTVNVYGATKSGTTGDLTWTLDQNTGVFTLSGSGRGANYANATLKRAPWYTSYRTQIKSVIIESGVIEVGAYSFYNCTNLTSVTIADSVDTIGDCCFRNCTSLQSASLPSGCSWMYKEVFLDCTSLKWVELPDRNSTDNYSGKIPDGTFSGCTSLEEVYVGSGFSAMDQKAFYNCSKLKGVIWASGNITSVGTNALYNVPSSCKFASSSKSLSSFASSNNVTYDNGIGTCSSDGNLAYSINTDNREISFSGSGTMSTNPWSIYHYLLKSVNFSGVTGDYSIMSGAFQSAGIDHIVFDTTGELVINSNAFADCKRTTFWLNIPVNTKAIGSKAFYNTNFNYVTVASTSISIETDSFGDGSGSYARFFGLPNSGTVDFVKEGQKLGYNWYYFCYNDNHNYTYTRVEPTCTEQGYVMYSCSDCDADQVISEYIPPLDHMYSYISTNGADFVYSCKRCGRVDITVDAIIANSFFGDSLSRQEDSQPYQQSNYNGIVDIYKDGYVTVKDYYLIRNAIEAQPTTNKKTTIDESVSYQTIEGFGASAAWWAQDVGLWEQSNVNKITQMLFNEEKGIGLDIYRYNLGAGSNDDSQLYEVGKRTRCFLQNDGTYDWNNDPGAMNVLASAQGQNDNLKVTLFCNSAPTSMTINGKAYCSTDATSNLDESNYQAFSNYVVTCAEHFMDLGYNVTELSPINEPEWSWACWQNGDGTYSMNQEGCHWTESNARTFYNNYFIPTVMNNERLNGRVGVSVWESGQINHSTYWNNFLNYFFSSSSANNYAAYNANIRNYVDTLDVHSYWASESDRNTVATQIKGSNYSAIKKVRCTEYCQMTNDGNTGVYDLIQSEGVTNGMTIDYGLALADIMYQDLTILNATEWDWWVGCAYGVYPDALIYVNANNHSDIQASKRLWVMGNYSKFIDEGAKRIMVSTESGMPSTVKQSAYLNPDGTVAVVYINSSTTTQYTAFDSSKYSTYSSYVTDATLDLKLVQKGNVNGKAVAIPARSVTTVVLSK